MRDFSDHFFHAFNGPACGFTVSRLGVRNQVSNHLQGIPQFGTQSVAEHTFALIFGLAKNLRLGHQHTA